MILWTLMTVLYMSHLPPLSHCPCRFHWAVSIGQSLFNYFQIVSLHIFKSWLMLLSIWKRYCHAAVYHCYVCFSSSDCSLFLLSYCAALRSTPAQCPDFLIGELLLVDTTWCSPWSIGDMLHVHWYFFSKITVCRTCTTFILMFFRIICIHY